jgi:hypothetical protein
VDTYSDVVDNGAIFRAFAPIVRLHSPSLLNHLPTNSYNASVFKIVTSNGFNVLSIPVQSDDWNRLNSSVDTKDFSGGFWNMTNTEWSSVYSQQYMSSSHGDLYLAIDRVAFDTSQTITNTYMSEYVGMNLTGGQEVVKSLAVESFDWIRHVYQPKDSNASISMSLHVAHAFSQKAGEPSRVQISLYFMVIVVVFNLLKLLTMASVLLTDRAAYLVTIGDAAASFLERQDPTTTGKCMLGKEEMIVSMDLPLINPLSTHEEWEDLRNRVRGVWAVQSRKKFRSVSRHDKIIYSQL